LTELSPTADPASTARYVPTLRSPQHRASPRARWMWLLGGLVGDGVAAGVGIAVALVWDWLGENWWIVAVIVGLSLVQSVVSPWFRYKYSRWEVTDNAVYVQSGWLSITREIAPMSRIQTVQYSQSMVARLFGLASVSVTTASALGDLKIEAVDRATAAAIADDLTAKADLDDSDAT
jgi:membrane protein YdbS with pleckstrin-like domain